MRIGRLWLEARRHERERKKRELETDRQLRYLRLEWDEGKRFLHLEGDLAAEEGAQVEAALERRAREVVLEDGVVDRQGARLADALTELVSSKGDPARTPTLVVHADAEVLCGLPARRDRPGLAETESGVQLSDSAVRRLACDSRIEWVIEKDGRAVGIGRQSRVPPGWMMRQLRYRDRECQHDGCDRKRYLHAHHQQHWPDGGRTDMDNLKLLCSTHHRQRHEQESKIRGEKAWRRPATKGRSLSFVAASFP